MSNKELIAEARRKAHKAYPHRNPYLEGGAYAGEERSREPYREGFEKGYLAALAAVSDTTPSEPEDEQQGFVDAVEGALYEVDGKHHVIGNECLRRADGKGSA
jgi:hypothetical protein